MALIGMAADKGSPGVTTSALALAAVWPRPVLLAECDPAGADLGYWLPAAEGGRLDPHRGLLSMAVATRRGAQPHQVWEHTQKLRGGLDVLIGVTTAEQGAGLEPLWGPVGLTLSRLPQADVIADCGRIGPDGPQYDLLAHASSIVLITRDSLGEIVRLRERIAALTAGLARRGQGGIPVGVVVIAGRGRFHSALVEVADALGRAAVIGGLAYEPASAGYLHGEWGGKLDRSLLVRTARAIASQLAGGLPTIPAATPAPQTLPPRLAAPQVIPPRAVAARAEAAPGTLEPARAEPAAGTRGPAQAEPGTRGPAQAAPGTRGPAPAEPPPGTRGDWFVPTARHRRALPPDEGADHQEVRLTDIPQPTSPGGM